MVFFFFDSFLREVLKVEIRYVLLVFIKISSHPCHCDNEGEDSEANNKQ